MSVREGRRTGRGLSRVGQTVVVGLLAITVLAGSAPGQTNGRPRIGLVLGGGGAKGIAHVGVLKVLEEMRIPIDFVAGTSMGSIVGGFYAAGMSPEEIQQTLQGMDWWDAMKDRPGRRDLFYRRKEDTERYFMDFEMGLTPSGITLPRATVAGQKLNYTLQTATLNAADVEDFDHLQLPFRCVATDVKEGTPVVLGHGNLAEAMRASMAVPGLFTPVTMEGKLLVDGGLVNNIPVDVVKAMGADVVIAVDVVGSDLDAQKARLETMADLLARTYSILKRPMEVQQLAAADLVITPQQSDLSAGAFYLAPEFVARGQAAAQAMADGLQAYSVDEKTYRAYLARQRRIPRSELKVKSVDIETTGNLREDYLLGHVKTAPGDELDPRVLRRDVDRIYGLGYFERVDYRIREVSSGEVAVAFRAEPKPWGPTYLRFGLRMESDLDNRSDLQFLLNVTATELNRFGAEWRNDLILGDQRDLRSEFYQPLHLDSRLFVAARLEYLDDLQNVFSNDKLLATYELTKRVAMADVGVRLDTFGELRGGLYGGQVEAGRDVGGVGADTYDDEVGGAQARLAIDKLDSGNFPRKGYFLNVSGRLARESLGNATEDYDRLEVVGRAFKSWGRHTIQTGLRYGSSLGTEVPPYDQFLLGGFSSLVGYEAERYRGPYMAAARLGYYYQVSMLSPSVGKGVYLGVLGDGGNTWASQDDMSADDLHYGGALAVGLDTVFGPIYLALGRGEDHSEQYLFSLGNRF